MNLELSLDVKWTSLNFFSEFNTFRFHCSCLCIIRIEYAAQLWIGSLPLVSWWGHYRLQRWFPWNRQKKWNAGEVVWISTPSFLSSTLCYVFHFFLVHFNGYWLLFKILMQYGLPLKIVSYKDLYGWTMDEIVKMIGLKNNCTFCGVFRRQVFHWICCFYFVKVLYTCIQHSYVFPIKYQSHAVLCSAYNLAFLKK